MNKDKIDLQGGIDISFKNRILKLFPNVEHNCEDWFESFEKTNNFTFRMTSIYTQHFHDKVKINIYIQNHTDYNNVTQINIGESYYLETTIKRLKKALDGMEELGVKEWFKKEADNGKAI